jgi:hypothetical protein
VAANTGVAGPVGRKISQQLGLNIGKKCTKGLHTPMTMLKSGLNQQSMLIFTQYSLI